MSKITRFSTFKECAENIEQLGYNSDRLTELYKYWSENNNLYEIWWKTDWEPINYHVLIDVYKGKKIDSKLFKDLETLKIPFIIDGVLVMIARDKQSYIDMFRSAPTIISDKKWNKNIIAPLLLDLICENLRTKIDENKSIDAAIKELNDVLFNREDGVYMAFYYLRRNIYDDKRSKYLGEIIQPVPFNYSEIKDKITDERWNIDSIVATLMLMNDEEDFSPAVNDIKEILLKNNITFKIDDIGSHQHYRIGYAVYMNMKKNNDYDIWFNVWDEMKDIRWCFNYDMYSEKYNYVGNNIKFWLDISLAVYDWLLEDDNEAAEVFYSKLVNILYEQIIFYSDDNVDFWSKYTVYLLWINGRKGNINSDVSARFMSKLYNMPFTLLQILATLKKGNIDINTFIQGKSDIYENVIRNVNCIKMGDQYKGKYIEEYLKIL